MRACLLARRGSVATSREQAVTLCEAMRRGRLITPVGESTPFTDGSAQYRFVREAKEASSSAGGGGGEKEGNGKGKRRAK